MNLFAHDLELEVQKYLPGSPYWLELSPGNLQKTKRL